MTPLLIFFQKAIIGAIGGLLAGLVDAIRGKAISLFRIVVSALTGGFSAQFFTPLFMKLAHTEDELFIAAILGILGYKVFEYLLSSEFWKLAKELANSLITVLFKK